MATQTVTSDAHELEILDCVREAPKNADTIAESSTGAGRALSSASSHGVDAITSATIPMEPPKLTTEQAWVVIVQLCGNNFINTFSAGLLLVCLPTMAADLNLAPNLLLWPTAATYLASASCQLIAGSIADVLGPRRPNTVGSFLQSIFIIATGFAQDGTQLIVFRTLLGIATSIFTTSGRSILSTNIERGRLRNFAFAAMVLCFPLGAGLGLVLGGVYADKSSWRVGYYSSGAVGLLLSLSGLWTLPKNPRKTASFSEARKRLAAEIDWTGALMASASLAMLSYVLAVLSASTDEIHKATNIILLAISLALIPAFAMWMRYRETNNQPALIPNSLWKSGTFTSVCIMIALSNATQTCLSFYVSLFFQEIQHLSAYQASIRLLPQAAVGCLMCLFVGLFVNKVTPYISIVSTMFLCSVAPLLMALTNPSWPYWYTAFWAQLLAPLSIDVMFVVGALVVADAFSGKSQARGAAVFGSFSQLGSSVGLCIMSVISNSVKEEEMRKGDGMALLKGYKASFYTQFAWILASCVIGAVGLRKLGKVGMKKD